MHSKSNYEYNDEDGVCHGGLDDREDDGIIGARIIFNQRRLHLTSYVEQTFCHKNGIKHGVRHLEGEVCNCGVDIVKWSPSTRLNQDDDGCCCSRRQ